MYLVYKQLGETPLKALERCRMEHTLEKNIPMTYAGRLDPMAEGLLIILTGDECKEKDTYLHLDKEYEFETLFGFSTDTGDLLGIVQESKEYKDKPLFKDIESILSGFGNGYVQKYPAYSSKTVSGIPLFSYARQHTEIQNRPEHMITINKTKIGAIRSVSRNDLEKEIIKKINLVEGDFRQKEIIEKWEEIFSNTQQEIFYVVQITISVSSGFYIRQFSVDLGEKVNVPCVTFSIKRKKIGDYELV